MKKEEYIKLYIKLIDEHIKELTLKLLHGDTDQQSLKIITDIIGLELLKDQVNNPKKAAKKRKEWAKKAAKNFRMRLKST
jgi:hypothetical protein